MSEPWRGAEDEAEAHLERPIDPCSVVLAALLRRAVAHGREEGLVEGADVAGRLMVDSNGRQIVMAKILARIPEAPRD